MSKYKLDLFIILILGIIFTPLYLLFLDSIPFQINTDEITIMMWAKELANQANPDLFGLGGYAALPSFIFIIIGKIAQALGGINLANIRLIHASFGLLIVILSYLFFRMAWPPFLAGMGAIILGVNHALVAISRMAMRENSGLLLEIMALGLLYYGFKTKQLIYLLLGSLITGLTFYVYFPSRMTIIIWILNLVGCVVFLKGWDRKFLLKTALISAVGFLIVASPIIVATIRVSPAELRYQREQLLIFAEGRKMQKAWIGAISEAEGLRQNIINGLTIFNNTKSDYSYIYPNPNHGFVDPLTGILVWLGVVIVIGQAILRSRINSFDLLNLTGLVVLLFTFSFITNKAPNYTRLLVILPFVVYFVVRGISGALELFQATNLVKNSVLVGVTSLILIWNLTIFSDFIQKGLKEGNDVGGTARYVEIRKHISGYKFYLSADKTDPYYSWGDEWQWRGWIGFFAGDHQEMQVLSPDDFIVKLDQPPFTVFMSKLLWIQSKAEFMARYPNFQIHHIKPDGSLVAIEVI